MYHLIVILLIWPQIGCDNLDVNKDLEVFEGPDWELISDAPMDVVDGTPKRIGDLEFDVEVDEQLPEEGHTAPEINVAGNEGLGGDSDVFTDVSFDMVSNSANIGDIELDVNVMNSRTRQPPQKLPQKPTLKPTLKPTQKLQPNSDHEDQDVVLQQSANPNGTSVVTSAVPSAVPGGPTNTSLPVNVGNTTTSVSITSVVDPNATLPTTSLSQSPADTLPPSQTDITTASPPLTTSSPSKLSMSWPIILIIVVFICIALLGCIWAFMKFQDIKSKDAKQNEEKHIAAAKAAKAKPGPSKLQSQQPPKGDLKGGLPKGSTGPPPPPPPPSVPLSAVPPVDKPEEPSKPAEDLKKKSSEESLENQTTPSKPGEKKSDEQLSQPKDTTDKDKPKSDEAIEPPEP